MKGTKSALVSLYWSGSVKPFGPIVRQNPPNLLKMLLRTSIAVLAAATLLLTSCRREKDPEPDLDYTSASDNSRAEDVFNDMLLQVDNAVDENGLRDECAPTVTFDTTSTPRTITLDFGSVNCTAPNGRLRRGRVQVSYTGHYRDQGTVITITPDNYHVNNIFVQGSKTVTNLGPNTAGHLAFSVVVNGTLTADDGSWTSTHQAQRTRTWIEGSTTAQILDDVYLITGNGSVVNRNGVAYSLAITNALRVQVGCPYITQGTVQVTPVGRPVVGIDWGSGTCDGTFTVTVNGQTYTVTIG